MTTRVSDENEPALLEDVPLLVLLVRLFNSLLVLEQDKKILVIVY